METAKRSCFGGLLLFKCISGALYRHAFVQIFNLEQELFNLCISTLCQGVGCLPAVLLTLHLILLTLEPSTLQPLLHTLSPTGSTPHLIISDVNKHPCISF